MVAILAQVRSFSGLKEAAEARVDYLLLMLKLAPFILAIMGICWLVEKARKKR